VRDPVNKVPPRRLCDHRSLVGDIDVLVDLARRHAERFEHVNAERCADGHVGGVSTAPNEHSTDSWRVVTGIEGKPAPPDECLEPRAEIHRRRIGRYANITEITRAVSRRNIEAATERDREMREVATDPPLLGKGSRGASGGISILIAERDMLVNEVADRLHPAPSWGCAAEQRPGVVHHHVRLAVTAAKEIDQRIVRQIGHSMFLRRGIDEVRLPAVSDDRIVRQPQFAGGRQQAHAFIPEPIDVGRNSARGCNAQPVGCDQIAGARGMNIEH